MHGKNILTIHVYNNKGQPSIVYFFIPTFLKAKKNGVVSLNF